METISTGELGTLAAAVKRGAELLDKKLPGWRKVMRRHRSRFVFSDCNSCVLGTLGNHDPRVRKLADRAKLEAFRAGLKFLTKSTGHARAHDFGFDSPRDLPHNLEDYYPALHALWQAEFENGK